MKLVKNFLVIVMSFLTFMVHSQVATAYTFSETTGTYTAIVGGTQLVTTTAGATAYDNDGSSVSLPASSQFYFNGTLITSVNMTADGALWLNPGTTTTGNGVTGPLASPATARGIISAMGMDLRSTQIASQVYERRWQDDGTEVIFQWQNCSRYSQGTTERFSFQIRITKTSGVVKIVYGNMTTIANSTLYQPQVGLRGSANTDFNNRRLTTSVPDATPNWGAPNGTTAGTSNSNSCRFTTGSPSCVPTSGLTFIWTPGPTIVTSGTLTAFSTCTNSASSSQSFTVAGYGLTSNITVTAPTGYQVSTDNTNFSSSVTLTQSGGGVSSTTIYARLASQASSPANGNITNASTSATTVNVAVTGSVISSNPTISTNPSNSSIVASNNTSFTIAATNVTSYSWQVSTDGGTNWSTVSNGGVYSGATTTSLSITAATFGMNGYLYRCVTTNCFGNTTSTSATLTVSYCTPSGGTPSYYIVNFTTTGGVTNINNNSTWTNGTCYSSFTSTSFSGTPNSTINFSITNGSYGSTDNSNTYYYYLWIDWNGDGDFADAGETIMATTSFAAGPKTGSFVIPSGQTLGSYRLRIANSYTGTNTSCSSAGNGEFEDYMITVSTQLPVITSFTPSIVCASSNETVVITGTNFTGASSVTIGGTVASSYTVNSSTQITATVGAGTTGVISVTTSYGTGSSSSNLTVNSLPSDVTVGTSGTYCSSTTLTASGGSGGTIYWQNTSTGGVSTNNATNSQSVSTSGTYYFRSQSAAGCWGNEGSATITITTPITIVTNPSTSNQSKCNGSTFSSISVSVNGTSPSYTWQQSTDGSTNWVTAVGGTGGNTDTYTPPCSTAGVLYYRCLITSPSPCSSSVASGVSGSFTVTQPDVTLINTHIGHSIESGDYVWNGSTNSSWTTQSNWYVYDGSSFNPSTSDPISTSNVYIVPSNVTQCINTSNSPTLSSTDYIVDLVVTPNATLTLSSTLTVNGDIVVDGAISGTGTIKLNGSGNQDISGSSTITLPNLEVNKSGGIVTVSNPLTISNSLTMVNGDINNGSNLIEVGYSVNNLGNIYWTSGTITGKVKRWFGTTTNSTQESSIFPIGNSTYNRSTQIKFTTAPSVGGYITAQYQIGTPSLSYSGLPLTTPDGQFINDYTNEGYWEITPDSYTGSLNQTEYTISLRGNNLSSITSIVTPRIIKSSGPSHTTWISCGTHSGSTGSLTDFTITSTNVTGFSYFDVGLKNDVALPVELSKFDGIKKGNDNYLFWITSSEHNTSHFNLQKSRDGETWKTITTLNAVGFSTHQVDYDVVDYKVEPIVNYYRLQQYDNDGVYETFGPISIDNSNSQLDKKVIKYIDLNGKIIDPHKINIGEVYIEVYSDGTIKRIIK